MRFIPKLTLDEIVYWGTLFFVVTTVGYLLVTLIHVTTLETTSFDSQESYVRKQSRYIVLETSSGNIHIMLLRTQAPTTVNNFISLAQAGFYDQTKFHRVVKGKLIQGGDPLSREDDVELYGTGNPGYVFDDEIRGLKMEKGVLAMVNLGRPKTNGSQFFILVAEDAPAMDGKYTIFGKVTDGMPVAEAISNVPVSAKNVPITPVVLKSVRIE